MSFLVFCVGSVFAGNSNAGHADSVTVKKHRTDAPLVTKSIVSFAPLQLFDNAYGFGVAAEHFLGKANNVSAGILLFATSTNTKGSNYNRTEQMTCVMPEVKFYVSSAVRTIRYALGPQLIAGIGEGRQIEKYGNQQETTRRKSILGAAVNNSINVYPFPHLYYGVDVGLGFSYIYTVGDKELGTQLLIHGGFKIGYRF